MSEIDEVLDRGRRVSNFFHTNHHHCTDVVAIFRSHSIVGRVEPMTGIIGGPSDHIPHNANDFHLILEPEENYAIAKSATDFFKLGRRQIFHKISLVNMSEWQAFLDCDRSLLSSPHFMLSRTTAAVFIEDLGSQYGTFLNGKLLEEKTKSKLFDGDIISLGISHLDPACDRSIKKYFVLSVVIRPTLHTLRETELHNGQRQMLPSNLAVNPIFDQTFRIHGILAQIIQTLPRSELKRLRFVNDVWNDVISKKLLSESVITFRSSYCNDATLLSAWDKEFRDKVAFMKTGNVKKIHVDIYNNRSHKVVRDIIWISNEFGPRLTFFGLKMEITNNDDAKQFCKFIKKSNALNELKLELFVAKKCKKISLPTPIETVKILHLSSFSPRMDSNNRPFILEAMTLFPNVETLKLNVKDFENTTDDAIIHLPFPNLSKLKLREFSHFFADILFIRNLTTASVIGLRTLEIKDFYITQTILTEIGGLLTRNALSLEVLSLSYSYHLYNDETCILTVPQFPNLKKLEVNVEGYLKPNDLFVGWDFITSTYELDFPLLQEIRLCWKPAPSDDIQLLDSVFEVFVPPDRGQHVQSLSMRNAFFDIPNRYRRKLAYGNRARQIFPNAVVTLNE